MTLCKRYARPSGGLFVNLGSSTEPTSEKLLAHTKRRGGKYEVKADFENGKGRYDILLRSNAPDLPHIIMELKRSRSNARPETVEANARDALEQIKDRDYTFGLNGNIILYGIAFKGKEAKVVSETMSR